MRPELVLLLLALPFAAGAQNSALEIGGHTKLTLTGQSWPDDSVIRDIVGSTSSDTQGELRLSLEWRSDVWRFDAAWQLVALNGDALRIGAAPVAGIFAGSLPGDDRRLFDLTDVVDQGSDSAILHRLDRLFVGYASDKAVVRFGRQALSWGNGLFYAPMDLVNPFDPSAIDTEYKPGDDMLYGQYLYDNGNDVQGAIVFRRNPVSGDVEEDESTVALKYHGFSGEWEFDALVARSYGDSVIGIGGGRAIGGAVWRADVVFTDAERKSYIEIVTNLSYSWTWRDTNMSGAFEYYFASLGQRAGRYDPASLAGNPELLSRLARGQSFSLGRHYVAANILVELTPLWTVSPVLLANVQDPSALLQLVTRYSAADNITLTGSINVPIGPGGSEFGGIETGVPGRRLSSGTGLFAQFAWYF